MTIKSQIGLFPGLLSNRRYSGTMSTLLYNWPLFAGLLGFGLVMLTVSYFVPSPWTWLTLVGGAGTLGLMASILTATFIVYDWGQRHEYDRLAELGYLNQANVVVDITCGKLRGTRGLLPLFKGGHYFLIDLYDPAKMTDTALRRARTMEPPLETPRRIYQRPGQVNHLPIPHQWADVIYCDFCLHEILNPADRDALFAELARVLKPDGRLLIAEHSRDLFNLLAFGPGALSFFPANTWQQHLTRANFTIHHHERWRGLVHLWVAGRQ